MANSSNDNAKLIVGAILSLIVLNKIDKVLQWMGLSKGEGSQAFELQNADPNSAFGVNYWRNFYYSGNTPANGRRPLTEAMLKRARLAANYFYYGFDSLGEDEAAIFKAFNMCTSKADVSLMAFIVQTQYDGNVLSLMKYGKGSLPNSGLSESELQSIFNKVSKLPNY